MSAICRERLLRPGQQGVEQGVDRDEAVRARLVAVAVVAVVLHERDVAGVVGGGGPLGGVHVVEVAAAVPGQHLGARGAPGRARRPRRAVVQAGLPRVHDRRPARGRPSARAAGSRAGRSAAGTRGAGSRLPRAGAARWTSSAASACAGGCTIPDVSRCGARRHVARAPEDGPGK